MKQRVFRPILSVFCAIVAMSAAGSGAFASTALLVSVPDQKLFLVRDGQRVASYKISTSKFGISDQFRSYGTPLGKLEVSGRIGAGLPAGAVLKGRQATGEVLPVNAKGRDPIVTRILCLRGLEASNANAQSRGIYIHGTPVERTLGRPDSWGCIRMRSADIIELFDMVPAGTQVQIVNEPARQKLPDLLASTSQGAVTPEAPAPSKVVAAQPQPPQSVEKSPIASTRSYGRNTLRSSLDTSSESPSLGGLDNFQAEQRHSEERRSGLGVSLSIW